ncbi:hypothetical protein M0R45_014910 [Rubus argutus]|uniref:Uncharacterized protein n=1 Tax=Rubus argutus TaxID=59490 RepID=A0AAW1XPQ5_RUBAR
MLQQSSVAGGSALELSSTPSTPSLSSSPRTQFHNPNLNSWSEGPDIKPMRNSGNPSSETTLLRKEKENRKPPTTTRLEMTPPWSKGNHGGAVSNSRGSNSASAGKKNRCNGGGGLMARKSYASLEELKGLSSAAGNAIIGGGAENRAGGRSGRATAKAVLGYRHF